MIVGVVQSATFVSVKRLQTPKHFGTIGVNYINVDQTAAEGKHVEGKHAEGKHVEGKHVEGKHVEGKHVEGKHVERKHVERKHVEGKPVLEVENVANAKLERKKE